MYDFVHEHHAVSSSIFAFIIISSLGSWLTWICEELPLDVSLTAASALPAQSLVTFKGTTGLFSWSGWRRGPRRRPWGRAWRRWTAITASCPRGTLFLVIFYQSFFSGCCLMIIIPFTAGTRVEEGNIWCEMTGVGVWFTDDFLMMKRCSSNCISRHLLFQETNGCLWRRRKTRGIFSTRNRIRRWQKDGSKDRKEGQSTHD